MDRHPSDSHPLEPQNPTSDRTSEHALEECFRNYQPELMGTLYYLVGNTEDARDAVQEAFVRCWRNRDQVPSIQNLKAWVFRIATNIGRDIRKAAWQKRRHEFPDDEKAVASDALLPQENAEKREEIAALRAAVLNLRPQEQEIFLMRQNGELTYEQIAEELNIPVGTVKTRMRSALSNLRNALSDKK